jgi:rhodanese-related sulfurtransferase
VSELEPEDVAEKLGTGEWQVVDVREPHERDAGYIEGTRHIEVAQLTAQAETLERDRPVIFYCRVGSRSAMATQAFRASGWDAYNMRGGIVEWAARGLPLAPEGGTVAEH